MGSGRRMQGSVGLGFLGMCPRRRKPLAQLRRDTTMVEAGKGTRWGVIIKCIGKSRN